MSWFKLSVPFKILQKRVSAPKLKKKQKHNIQLGNKESDLPSYFLKGNINWYNLSVEQLGNAHESLKKHVFHFQEFIQGKATLFLIPAFFSVISVG